MSAPLHRCALERYCPQKWKHIDFELATIALPSRKGDKRKLLPAEISRVYGSPYVLPSCKDLTQPTSIEVIENACQRIRIQVLSERVRKRIEAF